MKKNGVKSKKVIAIGSMVIVILVGGIAVTSRNSGISVQTIAVQTNDLRGTFSESGIVQLGEDYKLTSNISGKVLEVLVHQNQYVEAGEILAKIATDEYDYALNEHRSIIDAYKAQIEQVRTGDYYDKEDIKYQIQQLEINKEALVGAKKQKTMSLAMQIKPSEYIKTLSTNVQAIESQYRIQKEQLEADRALYNIGGVTEKELEQQEVKVNNLQNELEIAKTKYNTFYERLETLKLQNTGEALDTIFFEGEDISIESEIQDIEVNIDALKQCLQDNRTESEIKRLEALIQGEENTINELSSKKQDCTIVAKQSGYITELPIQNMSQVDLGVHLMTIKGDKACKVTVEVLTDCIPYLKVGDDVQVTQKLKDQDIILEGKISEIYNYAEPSLSALGLEEYRVNVIVELSEDAETLKDGYEVDCEFTLFNESNILSVPCSSVFEVDGADYVFVNVNGKCEKRKVEIKHKTNVEAGIISGLEVGDEVIKVANTEGVQEGIRIRAK